MAEETAEQPTESTEQSPLVLLQQELATAREEAAKNLEGWQRAMADTQNARRRFDKERLEARSNATIEVAMEIVPILDDFELAMSNVSEDVLQSAWYSGFQLIPRRLKNVLEKIGLERIETVGKPFDPQMHNAIVREASAVCPSDTIIREFQAGYKIGERILRPAVVVVAE